MKTWETSTATHKWYSRFILSALSLQTRPICKLRFLVRIRNATELILQ